MLVSIVLLGSGTPLLFAAGLVMHFVAIAAMDIPLNAYILEVMSTGAQK